jgi:hypothetical protein
MERSHRHLLGDHRQSSERSSSVVRGRRDDRLEDGTVVERWSVAETAVVGLAATRDVLAP